MTEKTLNKANRNKIRSKKKGNQKQEATKIVTNSW